MPYVVACLPAWCLCVTQETQLTCLLPQLLSCHADLVLASGYPLEYHKVITIDSYILNMYRIPHGKYRHTDKGPKPVVLLQHGVTLSSNSFVLLNANESMAYILADAGGHHSSTSRKQGNTTAWGAESPNSNL